MGALAFFLTVFAIIGAIGISFALLKAGGRQILRTIPSQREAMDRRKVAEAALPKSRSRRDALTLQAQDNARGGPLHVSLDSYRAAGGTTFGWRAYASMNDAGRRHWLGRHPSFANRLFPGGLPEISHPGA